MITDLDYRLIRPDQAANDYYIAIVNKENDEIKRLERERDAYKILSDNEKDQTKKEYYIKKMGQCNKNLEQYPKFGYDALKYRDNKSELYNQRGVLSELFLRKYGRYRIGYSSYIEFQDQLQLQFETIFDYYSDRFKVRNHYRQMFDAELKSDNPFTTRSETIMSNKSDNTSKEATLPDVSIDKQIYTGMGSQMSSNDGNVKVIDTSFITKLANINGYLSFDKHIIKDYLNEFNILFQRLVW